MVSKNVDVLYHSCCILGESPVWDEEGGTLFWVDIEACIIYEYNWQTQTVIKHQLEQRVSLVVPAQQGELIVSLQGGIARYTLVSRKLDLLTDLQRAWISHRCNDGACDASGKLWVGTMELNGAEGQGDLYAIDNNFSAIKHMEGVSIPNGLAWNKDDTGFYHTDSLTKQIRYYEYNKELDKISCNGIVIEVEHDEALPDGMAMDEEGMLWVALWGGFGVARYNPKSGKLLSFLKIPAPHVTSCAFAGNNLDKLIITTAQKGLSEQQLKDFPLSGSVFIAHLGIRGQTRHRCRL